LKALKKTREKKSDFFCIYFYFDYN